MALFCNTTSNNLPPQQLHNNTQQSPLTACRSNQTYVGLILMFKARVVAGCTSRTQPLPSTPSTPPCTHQISCTNSPSPARSGHDCAAWGNSVPQPPDSVASSAQPKLTATTQRHADPLPCEAVARHNPQHSTATPAQLSTATATSVSSTAQHPTITPPSNAAQMVTDHCSQ